MMSTQYLADVGAAGIYPDSATFAGAGNPVPAAMPPQGALMGGLHSAETYAADHQVIVWTAAGVLLLLGLIRVGFEAAAGPLEVKAGV